MKSKTKDIILIITLIIILNAVTITMVKGGKHISPNTISWVTGFFTSTLVIAILKRFDIYLDL